MVEDVFECKGCAERTGRVVESKSRAFVDLRLDKVAFFWARVWRIEGVVGRGIKSFFLGRSGFTMVLSFLAEVGLIKGIECIEGEDDDVVVSGEGRFLDGGLSGGRLIWET